MPGNRPRSSARQFVDDFGQSGELAPSYCQLIDRIGHVAVRVGRPPPAPTRTRVPEVPMSTFGPQARIIFEHLVEGLRDLVFQPGAVLLARRVRAHALGREPSDAEVKARGVGEPETVADRELEAPPTEVRAKRWARVDEHAPPDGVENELGLADPAHDLDPHAGGGFDPLGGLGAVSGLAHRRGCHGDDLVGVLQVRDRPEPAHGLDRDPDRRPRSRRPPGRRRRRGGASPSPVRGEGSCRRASSRRPIDGTSCCRGQAQQSARSRLSSAFPANGAAGHALRPALGAASGRSVPSTGAARSQLPSGAEDPGIGVVGEVELDRLFQAGLQLRVQDWDEDLDSAVQVPLHQVA